MEVINIFILVVIWNTSKNKYMNEMNRLVVNKAKELLNMLHEKVLEVENNKNYQIQEYYEQKDELRKVLIPNKVNLDIGIQDNTLVNNRNSNNEINQPLLSIEDQEINFLEAVEEAE